MERLINEDYFKDLPHSYGGKNLSYKRYNNKSAVDRAFESNDIYSKYKPFRKLRSYNPTYVRRKRELFQSDITYFKSPDQLVTDSGGYGYLLTVIDCFTKYVWVYPLERIDADSITLNLKKLFTNLEELPTNFNSDRGKEFKNRKVEALMREHNINFYFSTSERKCSIVERFNKTLQQLVYKLLAQKNTNNWVQVLPHAMKIYLNRKHRTTKFSPVDAEKPENEEAIQDTFEEKYQKAEANRNKPKFKVGDTIRIWVHRDKFIRAYHANYTHEYFTISEVLTNMPQPRYKAKDLLDDPLDFILHQNEIVKYTPTGEEMHKMEVLRRRTRNGRRECYVRWLGWPDKFNQWIPAADVNNI